MGQKCLNICRTETKVTPTEKYVSRQISRANSKGDYVEAPAGVVDRAAFKTDEDRRMVLQALNNHFIFTSLTDEDKEMVVDSMHLLTLEPGSIVFEQDRPSKSYFVVRSGLLEVFTNGRRVNKIKPGEGFGELALLHDNPRSATVRCVEFTALWTIDRLAFRKAIEDMNAKIYEKNREFLDKVKVLATLEPQQKDKLAASLVTMKFNNGQNIITEGEMGQHLYILKEGLVSVRKGGNEVSRFHPGDCFGEQALLYSQQRTATCVAIEGPAKCVVLSRDTLYTILGKELQHIIHKNMALQAMNSSETLRLLSKDQKELIFSEMTIVSYKAGDVVIHAGTPKQSRLLFVLEGNLKIAKTGELFMDKGTCLGDKFVTDVTSEEANYEDDIIAGGDIKVGEMPKYRFEVSIGGKFEDVVKENAATNILKNVYLFRTLPVTKMKQLFSIIQVQKFTDGEVIIRENTPGEAIFIVKRGSVDICLNGLVIRTVTKYDYFGERSILFDYCTTATCIARGNVTLWLIYKNEFADIADENMRKMLHERMKMQDERAHLDDLVVIKFLGKGMFGKVVLVRTAATSNYYALKAISRRKVEKYAIQEHLLVGSKQLEKQIMLHIDHPSVIKLVKTYKDTKRVYFLLEYVHGLELSVILRHVGLLSDTDALFYTASLIYVLQYLHERDIIYRDLKPDNVMVDASGYIKMIDFGTAKMVQGRTYTLVGTPHYMAPEVIIGKGYGKTADLWSLGICLYEFVCGGVPFGEEAEDPYIIYERILEMQLSYKNVDLANFPAKPLIEQLLAKVPEMRLGSGYEAMKKLEWFQTFDWDGLISQKLTPPYTPDVGEIAEEESDAEDDEDPKDGAWDEKLCALSEESDDSVIVDDAELDAFKRTIPPFWDQGF